MALPECSSTSDTLDSTVAEMIREGNWTFSRGTEEGNPNKHYVAVYAGCPFRHYGRVTMVGWSLVETKLSVLNRNIFK